jgi:septal ring factor EnvC (AmiA/AmiB activator)
VFSYFVKAWENLDLNQIRKKEIESKISKLQDELKGETTNCSNLKSQIAAIGTKILEIDTQMSVGTRYDLAKIKLELNNFFAGWQTYLAALHASDAEKQEATIRFNKVIETIIVVD